MAEDIPEQPDMFEDEIDLAETASIIQEGLARLESRGLNQRALIILIQAETRLSRRDIKRVLDTLPKMKAIYGR